MRNKSFPVILAVLLAAISIGIRSAAEERGSKKEPHVVVGKEITIAVQSANEEEDPVAAWGGGRYLVVWQSTRNGPTRIYGAQVAGDGRMIPFNGQTDGFPVSISPADQLFPALAWGDGRYLVVWQDLRSNKNWEIYGGRIDSTGHRLDPDDLPIGAGTGNRRHPAAAWNGENFLVVWMEERPGTGWDIVGRRVSGDGTLLDRENLLISGVKGDQTSPTVTWDGRNFFAVWMDGRQDTAQGIYGARIDPGGKLLDPEGIVIAAAPGKQAYPAVTWNGSQIVAVWADRRDETHHLLYGARIDSKGTVLDPNGVLLSDAPRLHMFPDISCRKSDCLVVWEEEAESGKTITGIQDIIRDVNGLQLKSTEKGLIAGPSANPIPISPRAPGNHFSRVSTDGIHYLVVWKDYRSKLAGGFGRLVDIPEASKP